MDVDESLSSASHIDGLDQRCKGVLSVFSPQVMAVPSEDRRARGVDTVQYFSQAETPIVTVLFRSDGRGETFLLPC